MDTLARFRAERLLAAMRATKAEPEEECVPCVAASPGDVPVHGLGALYSVWSSDGGEIRRRIEAGSLVWDLEEEGIPIVVEHDGGVNSVVGRLDTAVNTDAGMEVVGRLFEPGEADKESFEKLVNMIEENAVGWSIRMAEETGTVRFLDGTEPEMDDEGVTFQVEPLMELTITHARVRHLAIVDTPAFPGARPILGEMPVAASAKLAVTFPATHFEKWVSKDLMPLHVTPDGRIMGHAAGEGCFRNGDKFGSCQKYTADPDPEMRNFHTATVTLDDGEVIRAGNLTCASLHASVSMTHAEQRRHHEDTSTVWARVRAWNDSRGRLCISGSVIPGLDERLLKQVAGQAISVETWPVPGVTGLTLVGAHSVPVPAWPV